MATQKRPVSYTRETDQDENGVLMHDTSCRPSTGGCSSSKRKGCRARIVCMTALVLHTDGKSQSKKNSKSSRILHPKSHHTRTSADPLASSTYAALRCFGPHLFSAQSPRGEGERGMCIRVCEEYRRARIGRKGKKKRAASNHIASFSQASEQK